MIEKGHRTRIRRFVRYESQVLNDSFISLLTAETHASSMGWKESRSREWREEFGPSYSATVPHSDCDWFRRLLHGKIDLP